MSVNFSWLFFAHSKSFWRSYSHQQSLTLPAHWRPWLLHSDSFTECLLKTGPINFKVQILSAQWSKAFADEAQALNIQQHSAIWKREVILWGNEQPWVIARTIMPRATILAQPQLLNLKQQALGDYLFKQHRPQRNNLEIARTHARITKLPGLRSEYTLPPTLWSRRSVLSIQHHTLLVSEYLLPYLPAYPEA